MSIIATVALIRLSFLILWAFYALFEKDTRKLVWSLAFSGMAGNIGAALFGTIVQ
jgi:predicted permease